MVYPEVLLNGTRWWNSGFFGIWEKSEKLKIQRAVINTSP
jgi:hypothetical protein